MIKDNHKYMLTQLNTASQIYNIGPQALFFSMLDMTL